MLSTYLSRMITMILGFALVLYTTQYWGSEGRGVISILIANSILIGFFSNIVAGSSVSYFSNKVSKESILLYAYTWAIISTFILTILLGIFYLQEGYFWYLFFLSLLTTLLNANIQVFVGEKKMNWYNVYIVLQQAFHILFLVLLVTLFSESNVDQYFQAQILCCIVLFGISFYQISKNCSWKNLRLSTKNLLWMIDYGWKSQLSAFLQFLNYRLSFYFIEIYCGISQVGIYSVAVTLTESLWVLSRSLAIIIYSETINSEDEQKLIVKTKSSIKITFYLTLLSIILLIAVPNSGYAYIFGKDFGETKILIVLMAPGILAIAIGLIIGYYFAGKNQLKVLNIKSFFGLSLTIIFSYFLIPKWQLLGAAVATSLAYVGSSMVIIYSFYQQNSFRINEFYIQKKDFLKIFQKKNRKE